MRNPTEVGHWFRRNPAALGILLGRPPVDRTTVVAAHELAVLVYFEPADADIIEAAIDKLVFSGDHVLLRRFQWVILIYYPDNADGKSTTAKFTGTKAEAAGAARRKIDNWLREQKRRALLPPRPRQT